MAVKCSNCGHENPKHAVYCGMCSSSLHPAQTSDSTEPKRGESRKQESNLRFAGLLLMIAGIFAFGQAIIFFQAPYPHWFWTEASLTFCGTLEIVLATIIFYGGVNTIRRTKYRFSVAAAATAIISVGIAVSSVLGVIALLMILSSRGDFRG